jgi:hypothetical protein
MSREKSKGHLWQRGSAYYAIWYRNGHRFCVNTGKASEDEAHLEMARLIAECEAGNSVKPDKTPSTLKAILNEVWRWYRRQGRKSLEHVERHAKRIEKGLAGRRADEITSALITKYTDARLDEGMAHASINRELAFLRWRSISVARLESSRRRWCPTSPCCLRRIGGRDFLSKSNMRRFTRTCLIISKAS